MGCVWLDGCVCVCWGVCGWVFWVGVSVWYFVCLFFVFAFVFVLFFVCFLLVYFYCVFVFLSGFTQNFRRFRVSST